LSETRYLYCWFDTEYTTLELDRAKLLQVALIVTDDTLRPIQTETSSIDTKLLRKDGLSMCVAPPPREEMSDHVRDYYQPLLDECDRSGKPVEEVDGQLAAFMESFPETEREDVRERPIMAGNSIYADAFLARKYLPRFASQLNYRMFDVSTLKLEWLFHYRKDRFRKLNQAENIQKYYRGEDPIAGAKHDAYYDIQASMAELAYYRSLTRVES